MTYWLIVWMNEWINNLMAGLLNNLLTDWLTDWMTDWLIVWLTDEANSSVDYALITTMKQFYRVKHSINTRMTITIKLNAIKNNKLTIISTIRLIRPCETRSSVFKTTWPTLHSSPVLQRRRYMASSWPVVVPSTDLLTDLLNEWMNCSLTDWMTG